jgi:ATP-dependent RNA helicase DDX24/MAK5
LEFLVIDEADRMLEKAHFAELREILNLLSQCGGGSGPKIVEKQPQKPKRKHHNKHGEEEEEEEVEEEEEEDVEERDDNAWVRQTFVVSATLTLNAAMKLKEKSASLYKPKKKKRDATSANIVEELIQAIGFKRHIETVDLTTSKKLAESLLESKVECVVDDKDYYVYYWLLRYPSRTLIFVNSIDCLRRLSSILHLLQIEWYVILVTLSVILFICFFQPRISSFPSLLLSHFSFSLSVSLLSPLSLSSTVSLSMRICSSGSASRVWIDSVTTRGL